MPIKSANARFLSAAIAHEIELGRFTDGEVREILKILRGLDRDLAKQIERRTAAVVARGFDLGPYTTNRLNALRAEVARLTTEAYKEAGIRLRKDLIGLAKHEESFQRRAINKATGSAGRTRESGKAAIKLDEAGQIETWLVRVPLNQLKAVVTEAPFQGAILKKWVQDLASGTVDRVQRNVVQGILEGQSVPQIVQRIRGTAAKNYQDGVLEISRRHAETWVRTAIGHVSNSARDAVYQANADIIQSVTWISTLDSRSCEICVPRDGMEYGLDHEPIGHDLPWLEGPGAVHPNCRCTSTVNIAPLRNLGLDSRQAEDPEALRAAFGGPVSRKTTAEEWLRDNPDAAAKVYGKTRAEAFLRGDLSASDMLGKGGRRMLTLEELKLREAG